jgi:hypothetical protein
LNRKAADLSVDPATKLGQKRPQANDLAFKGSLPLKALHKLLIESSEMVDLLLEVCSVSLFLLTILSHSFTVTQRSLLAVVATGGSFGFIGGSVLLTSCEEMSVSVVTCVSVGVIWAWWIARMRVSARMC